MAISLNGMIADKNGNEDFLSHANWNSFVDLATTFGNFVVGRKTYEAVKRWDADYGFDYMTSINRVIVSKNSESVVPDDYIIADSPREALSVLNQKGHKKVLVTGGATLNSAFMQESLIDEVILNIEPALIGEGLPLFSQSNFQTRLSLEETRELEGGILQVRYSVQK